MALLVRTSRRNGAALAAVIINRAAQQWRPLKETSYERSRAGAAYLNGYLEWKGSKPPMKTRLPLFPPQMNAS